MSNSSGKILIIDDEEKLRKLLFRIVSLEGYEVEEAATLAEARKKLDIGYYHTLLCDVQLPDGNGVAFVEEFKTRKLTSEIILLTAHGSIGDGVQAMKQGAFDYLVKGNDNEKIIPLLEKAVEKAQQAERLAALLKKQTAGFGFENIVGESPALVQAKKLSEKVAHTTTSVLLLGETGTGKEVFAKAIHHSSPRQAENFVALNCAAFAKDILGSELFGHKAGAFTGAQKDKKGLFEEADGGTLFLDEIGEMDVDLQSNLLRVLESGEFLKVGATKTQKVNIRLIAATNKNLEEEAEKGNFRLDLFYRLSTFTINLPNLNHRGSDVLLLAQSFVDELALKLKITAPRMGASFKEALLKHHWRGNVRELRNVIERALIISDNPELDAQTLPFGANINGLSIPDSLLLSEMEKFHIKAVLAKTQGNKTQAAKLMGIGVTTLYRKIEEYQLD